jgi:hypothetical protein
MKRNLSLIFFVFLVFNNSIAQDKLYALDSATKPGSPEGSSKPVFRFMAYDLSYELDKITVEESGTHEFGREVASKIHLLEERYINEVQLVPGNPQKRKVIKKPLIYESVRNIEKYLKKGVKSGEISASLAAESISKVLDVALNVLTADTRQFETALSKATRIEEKIDLFTNSVELKY